MLHTVVIYDNKYEKPVANASSIVLDDRSGQQQMEMSVIGKLN